MNKKYPFSWFIFSLVILLLSACSREVDPDWVEEVGLYSDPAGNQPTDAYGWLDPFYLVMELGEAPGDTVVQISWIALDTNRLEPETVIKIEEQVASSRLLLFELTNEGNFWPVGDTR
jgi:hypothetical protein